MIKFFRKIRLKLLAENRFSKYLIYALGEIILVVIGILIALQINNWNLEKQDEIFEEKIIRELKTSIENDLKLFNYLEYRIRRKDGAIDSLLLVREGKLDLKERKLRNLHGWSRVAIELSFDKATFETLKNKGIQKLKTDSLRKEIMRFYEVFLPVRKIFINDIYNEDQPKLDQVEEDLKEIKFQEDYFELQTDSTYFIRTKYDFEKINHPIYYKYLLLQARNKKSYWGRIRGTIEHTEKILSLLNQEIETRFQD
ncbi:MAG: hypothetical protein CMB99_05000 [Flavobacteriaceae bacterium]|nr:hypothetical protein [Flavobacteriaceae bacterium]|tara:strand:- start:101573 stop:102337 length:765 start_codon:yes stop_codon:yes gene_type:complete